MGTQYCSSGGSSQDSHVSCRRTMVLFSLLLLLFLSSYSSYQTFPNSWLRRNGFKFISTSTLSCPMRLPFNTTLVHMCPGHFVPSRWRHCYHNGGIFSPQCFTLGSDRIFRLHDIAGQGIGGPSLCDVTASKLEYADDVGLLVLSYVYSKQPTSRGIWANTGVVSRVVLL